MRFSIAYSDLRESILGYLTGGSSLEEFEERFAESLQGYLDSNDAESISIANEVNAVLIDSIDEEIEESYIKIALYRALCPSNEPLALTRSSGYAPTSSAKYALTDFYSAVVASLVSEGVQFAEVSTSH